MEAKCIFRKNAWPILSHNLNKSTVSTPKIKGIATPSLYRIQELLQLYEV